MPKGSVNREELGKLIAKTSGAILMINESNYIVKSTSSTNTYTITDPIRVDLYMSRLCAPQCQVQASICS